MFYKISVFKNFANSQEKPLWNSGEPFFIKIDLERSDITLKKLSQIIQKELELNEDISFVITKRPEVFIRNDKDVKRLKVWDKN